MKRLLALFLALLFCLSLAACKKDVVSEAEEEKEQSDESVSDANEPDEDINGTGDEWGDGSRQEVVPEEPAPKEIVAEDLYNSDKSGHYKFSSSIYNKYGEKTYTFGENEKVHVYSEGFFISEIDGVFYLKNHEGKEITSSEALSVSGFGMLSDKAFLADGYVMAYVAKEEYNGTTYQMGILNTEGEWVLPLSGEYALLTCGIPLSKGFFEKSPSYANEDCFVVSINLEGHRYDNAVYNFKTDKMHYYENLIEKYDYLYAMDFLEIISDIEFVNGKFRYTYEDEVFDFYPDGTLNYSIGAMEYSQYGSYEKDGTLYLCGSDGWGLVFGNNRDGVTLDLKDDKNVDVEDVVNLGDGKWLISIVNNEGSFYYTVTDHTGAFLFEPIAFDGSYVLHKSGKGVHTVDKGIAGGLDQETGKKIVIDDDGSVLYTAKDKNGELSVQNGVVREYVKTSYSSGTAKYYFLPDKTAA